jgi:nucleotide-binding universal stress UspA family protein
MSDLTNRPIVVGNDGTLQGRAAVTRAAIVAGSRGAHLHVVCAHRLADSGLHRDERRNAPGDVSASVTPRGEAAEIAAEGVEIANAVGTPATAHAVHGSPAVVLREVASATGAQLIVLGASLLFPSISRQLAFSPPCEIAVVDLAYGPIFTLAPQQTPARQLWGGAQRASRSQAA